MSLAADGCAAVVDGACTVTVAVPFAFAAGGVGQGPVRLHLRLGAEQPGVVVAVTLKVTVWPLSSHGPGEMPVAQPATVWAPGVLEHRLGPPRP